VLKVRGERKPNNPISPIKKRESPMQRVQTKKSTDCCRTLDGKKTVSTPLMTTRVERRGGCLESEKVCKVGIKEVRLLFTKSARMEGLQVTKTAGLEKA